MNCLWSNARVAIFSPLVHAAVQVIKPEHMLGSPHFFVVNIWSDLLQVKVHVQMQLMQHTQPPPVSRDCVALYKKKFPPHLINI